MEIAFDQKLTDIQMIIMAKSSTKQQISQARKLRKRLINDGLDEYFGKLEGNSILYMGFIEQLQLIIDAIKSNQSPYALDILDGFTNEVKSVL